MAKPDSKYLVTVHLTCVDQSEGKNDEVIFDAVQKWPGVNYGAMVGLQEALQGTNAETIRWGKAIAESLGQPVPTDIPTTGKPAGKR